ncbi:MAG: AMP-binding protein, partial [Bacteroidetes bacterium]|nr:AMP-binding protein [Bacteroidota bacterium]
YERILLRGEALKGPKRALFFWALQLAESWEFDQKPRGIRALQWAIADRLIFARWREGLGGEVKGIVVGASACPVRVMRVFNAAGIPVREGYGLTEAAPALSFSSFSPGGALLGTVGQILDGVTLRINDDGAYRPGEGEILAHSDGVMLGYYKQADKTAEAIIIDDSGKSWLATGDVGMLLTGPNGANFLKITDRKKELLKTSGGKYVAPTPIESILKEHRLVDQAMVVCDNLKFVSVLLVPERTGLQAWCNKHQIPWTTVEDLIQDPRVIHRYQQLIDRVNPHFGHAEQIKKFVLLANPWEPVKSDGTEAELTPTLKLKRRVILEKYAAEIKSMYETLS